MKKIAGLTFSIKGLLVLVFLFPILSCATINEAIWPPTATPTPTATSTPMPTETPTPTRSIGLAEMDLQEIGLQESDLPEGYKATDFDDSNLFEQLDDSTDGAISRNFEKRYTVLFASKNASIYLNIFFVYQDADSAKSAYEAYVEFLSAAEALDIPGIGEESIGRRAEGSGLVSYVILWRYREAVIELDYAGADDIGIEELVPLSQIIQSRLEAA